ncbi:hypothetical protein DFQ02_103141 [Seonamhaeicola aphaedonensis]|uniref:Uncharacterized protein n=2 Tax=Seonamhaeicola aphaedonensis TaxID=1461338 RepID=A0A3D9HHT3_9FLAO|nr:hypothetical protein DFQ02_103141 [Seonamhaeicola aphaedonensis]
MALEVHSGENNQSGFPISFFGLFPVIMLLYVFFHFGWFWSISIGLQEYIPTDVKMKVKKFKILFWIPVIYIALLVVFMGLSYIGVQYNDSASKATISGALIAMILIVPLHLFSMFCIFYCLYFTAKTYKTVQLQREVNFGDFAGEFFLFWFYFVGIWIVQPKINKLLNK